MPLLSRFLLICLGGAIGTGARHLIVFWAINRLGTAFPFGTLLVNLAGSFLLGLVMHVGMSSDLISATARIALTNGVLGGFTTYSSFNYETTAFFRGGAWWMGSLNIAATVLGCLAAGLLGIAVGRLLIGR